jgi:mannose-6-phosphate isomerase-like protein (cupin superfamily)
MGRGAMTAVANYAVGSIDTIPAPGRSGGAEWKPLRHHFGITGFGVNAWVASDEGDEVIQEHTEVGENVQGHEELYVVTRGYATFTVDGEDVEAPAGTVVFVADPSVTRRAVARMRGTTVLAIGHRPGSFDASPWERRDLS